MRAGPALLLCLILSMLAGCSDKGRDHEPTAAYAYVHEESSRAPVAAVTASARGR